MESIMPNNLEKGVVFISFLYQPPVKRDKIFELKNIALWEGKDEGEGEVRLYSVSSVTIRCTYFVTQLDYIIEKFALRLWHYDNNNNQSLESQQPTYSQQVLSAFNWLHESITRSQQSIVMNAFCW